MLNERKRGFSEIFLLLLPTQSGFGRAKGEWAEQLLLGGAEETGNVINVLACATALLFEDIIKSMKNQLKAI